jgi:LacI family transcriptional regulator
MAEGVKKSIHQIAKEAGVSVATVSRVLNDSPRVRAKTRSKILSVIQKNQYAPKPIKGRSASITVLLHGVDHKGRESWFEPYLQPILDGVMEVLTQRQVGVVILPVPASWTAWRVLDGVRKRQTGAVISILSPAHDPALRLLTEHSIPFLVINNGANESYHRIGTDNRRLVEMLVEHALMKGKRRLFYLSPSLRYADHEERLKSIRELAERRGFSLQVEVDAADPDKAPDNFIAGYRLAQALPVSFGQSDSVLCGNPEIAIGCLRAFGERGVSVPNGVSLGVIDDYLFGEWMHPSLTCAAQPLRAMGVLAGQKILSVFRGEVKKPLDLMLDPVLSVRSSL